MSKLRSRGIMPSRDPALPDETVLFLVNDSVARRRALIHGKLTNAVGEHCAMGCFWEDNPGTTVNTALLDEIATVNDSLGPDATPQQRWKKVSSWLRFKLASLSKAKA